MCGFGLPINGVGPGFAWGNGGWAGFGMAMGTGNWAGLASAIAPGVYIINGLTGVWT